MRTLISLKEVLDRMEHDMEAHRLFDASEMKNISGTLKKSRMTVRDIALKIKKDWIHYYEADKFELRELVYFVCNGYGPNDDVTEILENVRNLDDIPIREESGKEEDSIHTAKELADEVKSNLGKPNMLEEDYRKVDLKLKLAELYIQLNEKGA